MEPYQIRIAVRELIRRRKGSILTWAPVAFFNGAAGSRERIIEIEYPLEDTISPLLAHIFSCGQCHALALALHEILGWKIIGIYPKDVKPRRATHVVVAPPSGRTADIYGIRTIDYFIDNRLLKISPETIRKERLPGYLPPAMDLARHYASLIAAEMVKQHETLAAGLWKPKWTFCED